MNSTNKTEHETENGASLAQARGYVARRVKLLRDIAYLVWLAITNWKEAEWAIGYLKTGYANGHRFKAPHNAELSHD